MNLLHRMGRARLLAEREEERKGGREVVLLGPNDPEPDDPRAVFIRLSFDATPNDAHVKAGAFSVARSVADGNEHRDRVLCYEPDRNRELGLTQETAGNDPSTVSGFQGGSVRVQACGFWQAPQSAPQRLRPSARYVFGEADR